MTEVDVARLQGLLDAVQLDGDVLEKGVCGLWVKHRDGNADALVADFPIWSDGYPELIVAAVNAMPALLGVVAERDRLAATVARVEALADSMDRNGDPGCADLVLHVIGDAL